MRSDPPRDASLPPGYDEEDPYADEDLDAYPEWWRRNVEEFEAFGMRPYRPPRLADGTISPPVLADLAERYDVEVQFRSMDPESGRWELVVDGNAVTRIDHERDGAGFTRFHIEPEELEQAVEAEAQRST